MSWVRTVLRHYDNFRWQRYGFLFETQNYPYVFYSKNENESQGQVRQPERVNQGCPYDP